MPFEPIASNDITLITTLKRLDVDDRAYRRAVSRGQLVRLHPGAFISAEAWRALDDNQRYRKQALAASPASRSPVVLSHYSAAALWGVTLLDPWPRSVHCLSSPSTGTRAEGGWNKHASAALDSRISIRAGVIVTDLERTLLELATVVSFANAVAAIDWALRPSTVRDPKPATTIEALRACLAELGIVRGRRKVLRALEFATGLSGSPGESLSRVVIHELGFPEPELQHSFFDHRGHIGDSDFWWPEYRLFGEFDGLGKYLREIYTNGRTTAQVVIDEKRREDRIRGKGPSGVRWGWQEARSPMQLRGILLAAGLPLR